MSTKPRIDSAIAGAPADFGSVMIQVPNTKGKFFEL